MSPVFVANNSTDLRLTNAELLPNSDLTYALRVKFANHLHLNFSEFGLGMIYSLASLFALFESASFVFAILHVFSMRTKPEMGRIDTGGIVTTRTIMADMQPIGNGTIVNYPRKTVRAHLPTIYVDTAVPLVILAPGPNPAGFQLEYLFPEASFGRDAWPVPLHKSIWLPFDLPASSFCFACNAGWLTTAAFAKFYRGFVSGMIGAHKKFTFLVSNPGALSRRCPVLSSALQV